MHTEIVIAEVTAIDPLTGKIEGSAQEMTWTIVDKPLRHPLPLAVGQSVECHVLNDGDEQFYLEVIRVVA